MEPEQATDITTNWTHILLLGCDSQTVGDYERSDVNIVLSITPDGVFRLTSLLRDLWVDLPGFGEGKLNAAAWYGGPELAMQVVNTYFDLPITKYAMVNMESMVNIIDLIGGVDVEINEEERIFINHCAVDVQRIIRSDRVIQPLEQPGWVHLCGAQAVGHMRNRRNGGDYLRASRHRKVLKAIVRKAKMKKNLPKFLNLALHCRKWLKTNLTLPELGRIARLALRQNPDAISEFRIPAIGTYTTINDGIWRFQTDYEANRELLRTFLITGQK